MSLNENNLSDLEETKDGASFDDKAGKFYRQTVSFIVPWLATIKLDRKRGYYTEIIRSLLPGALEQKGYQPEAMNFVLRKWLSASDKEIITISRLLKRSIWLGQNLWWVTLGGSTALFMTYNSLVTTLSNLPILTPASETSVLPTPTENESNATISPTPDVMTNPETSITSTANVIETPNNNQQSPEQFIRDYFSVINNRQYSIGWDMLSPEFKTKRNQNYNDYVGWWETVEKIEINQVNVLKNDNKYAQIEVVMKFFMKTGKIFPQTIPYELVWDTNSSKWMIYPGES
jgi:hypothetical protein